MSIIVRGSVEEDTFVEHESMGYQRKVHPGDTILVINEKLLKRYKTVESVESLSLLGLHPKYYVDMQSRYPDRYVTARTIVTKITTKPYTQE